MLFQNGQYMNYEPDKEIQRKALDDVYDFFGKHHYEFKIKLRCPSGLIQTNICRCGHIRFFEFGMWKESYFAVCCNLMTCLIKQFPDIWLQIKDKHFINYKNKRHGCNFKACSPCNYLKHYEQKRT